MTANPPLIAPGLTDYLRKRRSGTPELDAQIIDILYHAERPVTVSGLVNRLCSRYGHRPVLVAMAHLALGGEIIGAECCGRQDCYTLPEARRKPPACVEEAEKLEPGAPRPKGKRKPKTSLFPMAEDYEPRKRRHRPPHVTRTIILQHLEREPATTYAISQAHGMCIKTVRHHFSALQRDGLILPHRPERDRFSFGVRGSVAVQFIGTAL